MDNVNATTNLKNMVKSFLTATIFVFSFFALVFSNLVDTSKISFPVTLIISLIVLLFTLFLIVLSAREISLKQGMIFLTLCAFYFVAYLFHTTGLEYLINIISITGILILIPRLNFNTGVYTTMRVLFFIYIALVIIFAPKSVSGVATGVVSFNNLNPNLASLLLMTYSVFLLSLISNERAKGKKIVLIILLFLVYYFQFRFSSRIALVGSILGVVYYIFKNKLNKLSKNKITVITLTLLLLSPIFCYLYSVTLFDMIGKGNLIIMGKDIFTGRQVIWQEAFEFIKNDFILGVGNVFKSSFYDYDLTQTATNLHNQMMGCLVCFGIVNMVLFAISYAIGVGETWKKSSFKFTVVLLLIFAVVSYTETIFYSSNIIHIVIFGLFMTSGNNLGEDNDKENSLRLDRE